VLQIIKKEKEMVYAISFQNHILSGELFFSSIVPSDASLQAVVKKWIVV